MLLNNSRKRGSCDGCGLITDSLKSTDRGDVEPEYLCWDCGHPDAVRAGIVAYCRDPFLTADQATGAERKRILDEAADCLPGGATYERDRELSAAGTGEPESDLEMERRTR